MDKPYATKTPLLEEDLNPAIGRPDYSEEEEAYLTRLQTRLEQARDMKESPHVEFDMMTHSEWWDANEKGANTFVEPKKNRDDSTFQSGTIRQKLLALLASLNNLNLSPDISAFDSENFEIQHLGDSMESVMLKSDELDEDAEKKLLRQYELLKQGTVFVEEIWDEKFIKDKKIKGNVKFDGKLKGISWTEKLKRYFSKPSRKVINSLMVYLGDIRQYSSKLQPYIFTVDIKPYEVIESIYGNWDRWKYVSKTLNQVLQDRNRSIYDNNWRLLQIDPGQCEVIKYQDKWNNEFAIIINGVLMTPVGLPFPWGYNEYNIEQQNLEPIHSNFAYGNSLVHKMKTQVGLLDEMIRMAVLKTQKSFAPPLINLSGRVLSRIIFTPGKINNGIPDGSLKPLLPDQSDGVNNSELAMIKMLEENINQNSVSPTFAGQQAQGDPTATQIIEQQRQAKLVLGLTIFACSLLEWKISWLRLYNLIENWFEPIDEVVDEVRNRIISKYRTVNVPAPIDGEGMGVRMVIPTKDYKSPEEIDKLEKNAKEISGKPTRIMFLNPEQIKSLKIYWQIVVKPKERITNELSKLMFRAELADAQLFAQDLNIQYLEEKFANIWEEDASKMFNRKDGAQFGNNPPPQGAGMGQNGGGQVSSMGGGSNIGPSVPKPEQTQNKAVATALKQ